MLKGDKRESSTCITLFVRHNGELSDAPKATEHIPELFIGCFVGDSSDENLPRDEILLLSVVISEDFFRFGLLALQDLAVVLVDSRQRQSGMISVLKCDEPESS